MRSKGSATELESRRLKAIELLQSGLTPTEVSVALGVVRQTVQKWKACLRDGGKKALKAKPHHINTCRLSVEQQKRLGKIILDGAAKAGFATDLWTTARIAQVIKERFGIGYNADHVGRMLRKLGFSCQKPARRAREQNEHEVRRWRKKEWPRIKKGSKIAS